MSLFQRPDAKKPAPRSVRPAPQVETADDVKLLNSEPAIRRNVPAVAMGGVRRPQMALPSPSYGRNEPSAGEKRLIVGRDIALAGEIAECDQLVVEGTMDATLRTGKRLDIYPTGIYRGAANVQEAEIAGQFSGELNVSGRLRLRASAQISGTIRYAEIEVEAGAQISGTFEYVAATAAAANDAGDNTFYSFSASAA